MTRLDIRLLTPTLLLLIAQVSPAQRIIYDSVRDKIAQDSVTAAKDVTSGALFDKMLQNLDAQAKLRAQTVLEFARESASAKLNNATYWKDERDKPWNAGGQIGSLCYSIACELTSLTNQIESKLSPIAETPAQIQHRMDELAAKQKELEAAIQALAEAAKANDPLVVQAFAWINDNGADLLSYANKVKDFAIKNPTTLKGASDALEEIRLGMDQMLLLYHSVIGIVQGYQAINVNPASLRPPQAQIDLQLVGAEQEHLKNLTLIRARAKLDSAITLRQISGALNLMNSQGVLVNGTAVEKSLTDAAALASRERLELLLTALHRAETAFVEEDVAATLGSLREASELRRYSIRRSAIQASAYDSTVQSASQRLALYWKSGIRPADAAALLFYLTNTVAIPMIATK